MLTLADALTSQRQKREAEYNEHSNRWQYAQKVLYGLTECLAATQLPRWSFTRNGEELLVLHQPSGTRDKERVGVWYVDDQYRLAFGEEKTEWITPESWRRVIDKAIVITANAILDREKQLVPSEQARAAPHPVTSENGKWQPGKASPTPLVSRSSS